MVFSPNNIKRQATKAYGLLASSDKRVQQQLITDFAIKYGFVHFKSSASQVHAIRGSTMVPDQIDTNYCVGTHDGIDISFVERTCTVEFEGYQPTRQHWHIMQFDLHTHTDLPLLFVGTSQQTKAFYARLLSTHRQLLHLDLGANFEHAKQFHSHYVIIASPADLPLIYQLFTPEIMEKMGTHAEPFAIEIHEDSLSLITNANRTTEQSLTKMLHYGIWLAKHIDERLK
jgi:hypothetical protein